MARVGRAHHVFRVEALLRKLGHAQRPVLLRPARGQGREAHHEEVETRERHHVNGQLSEVAVELAGEPEGAGGSADCRRHQVIQVAVRRGRELERPEADVVQRLVVEGEALVGVFHQLVYGQRCVVRLHDGVGHLRGRDDRVGGHHSVGVLLTYLWRAQGEGEREAVAKGKCCF